MNFANFSLRSDIFECAMCTKFKNVFTEKEAILRHLVIGKALKQRNFYHSVSRIDTLDLKITVISAV